MRIGVRRSWLKRAGCARGRASRRPFDRCIPARVAVAPPATPARRRRAHRPRRLLGSLSPTSRGSTGKIVHDTVHDAKDRLPERTAVTGVVEGANRRHWWELVSTSTCRLVSRWSQLELHTDCFVRLETSGVGKADIDAVKFQFASGASGCTFLRAASEAPVGVPNGTAGETRSRRSSAFLPTQQRRLIRFPVVVPE